MTGWTDEARAAAAAARSKSAHQNGVDKVGQPVLSPQVLAVALAHPGGFSVTPDGKQPTSGFMVAVPGRSIVVHESDLKGAQGRQILENYAKTHADILRQPGAHLGGWTDKATGKTYIDVSHNIASQQAAIKAGRSRNQIAIYDVKHGKDIKTGGTGL